MRERTEQTGHAAAVGVDDHLFREFVENVRDYAIFMLDPQGNVLTWNRGARRIKGYEPHEIVGQHFSRFYPPEDIASHKPEYELRVAAADGRFEDWGWRLRKDGSVFWANVIITALRGSDGKLAGYTKVTRDMTERRQAEEALRESEARYRLLLENVRDHAVFMLDAAGRVRTWNAGAQRIKGWTAGEIVGQHMHVFYPEEERVAGRPQRLLAEAAQRGRTEDEGWRVRKDGTRFWAHVTINAIQSPSGELLGFSKVTRDLSERRTGQTERAELAQAAREAQESTRELEAFSYTVAHDLREPLRGILTLSELLAKEHAASLDEDGRDLLARIQRSGTKMTQLVEDLLNFSRATKSAVSKESVDLGKVAAHIHERTLRSRDPGRLGTLRIADDLVAWGDPGLLRIAMDNLLGNAWKFTRTRERYEIVVGKHDSADTTTFFVRDNGVGFDPARAGELFQPFRRLHGGSEFEGTGVGLATVHRIVDRHDGRVWAEGTPGKGATIYFTLPKRATSP